MSKKKTPEEAPEEVTTPSAAAEEPEAAESAENSETIAEELDPLAQAQQEAADNHDLYLRARADLENYRRRAQKDKEDLAKFANENLLREMLPVLDNLSRALEHAKSDEADGGALIEGVEMTLVQFNKTLEQFGVTLVEAVGQPFNPDCHEAMGQMETAEHPPNTVVQEMQKGYYLNQRLLRPALVMIAKAPEKAAEETDNDAE